MPPVFRNEQERQAYEAAKKAFELQTSGTASKEEVEKAYEVSRRESSDVDRVQGSKVSEGQYQRAYGKPYDATSKEDLRRLRELEMGYPGLSDPNVPFTPQDRVRMTGDTDPLTGEAGWDGRFLTPGQRARLGGDTTTAAQRPTRQQAARVPVDPDSWVNRLNLTPEEKEEIEALRLGVTSILTRPTQDPTKQFDQVMSDEVYDYTPQQVGQMGQEAYKETKSAPKLSDAIADAQAKAAPQRKPATKPQAPKPTAEPTVTRQQTVEVPTVAGTGEGISVSDTSKPHQYQLDVKKPEFKGYVVPESEEWNKLSDQEKTLMAAFAVARNEPQKLFGGRLKSEGGFLGIGAKRGNRFSEDQRGQTPAETAYLNRVAKMLNQLLDKDDERVKGAREQTQREVEAEDAARAQQGTVNVSSAMPSRAKGSMDRLFGRTQRPTPAPQPQVSQPQQEVPFVAPEDLRISNEYFGRFGREGGDLPVEEKKRRLEQAKQEEAKKEEKIDWSGVNANQAFAASSFERKVAAEFKKMTGREPNENLSEDERLLRTIRKSLERSKK